MTITAYDLPMAKLLVPREQVEEVLVEGHPSSSDLVTISLNPLRSLPNIYKIFDAASLG